MSFIDFVRFNWNADPLAPGRNMRNLDQIRMRRRELRREHNNNRRVQQGNLRARIPIRRIARHIPPNRRDELVRFNELRLKRANDQNANNNNNNNNNNNDDDNLIVNNNPGLNHYYLCTLI